MVRVRPLPIPLTFQVLRYGGLRCNTCVAPRPSRHPYASDEQRLHARDRVSISGFPARERYQLGGLFLLQGSKEGRHLRTFGHLQRDGDGRIVQELRPGCMLEGDGGRRGQPDMHRRCAAFEMLVVLLCTMLVRGLQRGSATLGFVE